MASSTSGASAAATAIKLRDEAFAAAQKLEEEAASLHSTNTERSQQLQTEADLLKSAAAAQDRVRAAADALEKERAQDDALEQWRGYVLLILGRFALKDHVLSDASRFNDPAWSRMDCVVVSWIFNTISTDLLDVIHERDDISARAAWLGIEQQFLNNRESRAMLLDAEFRTITQGGLSIDDYCHKMKGMADALADLSEPVHDRTLVLNILRGLNERFQLMSQFITRQKPFPSFADVRADLRLAELNMAPPSAPPSALVVSSSSKPPAVGSRWRTRGG
ncbi:uncharacterized protein [Miscanthus floridulus]|uniref:uncharacterized protein n=1 Tax=Miscanthus floridulus TaxID=154761 RepID=UPI00345922A5